MKDISIYFTPLNNPVNTEELSLGTVMDSHTEGHFPELKKGGVALFYVPEFRGQRNGIQIDNAGREHFRTSLAELNFGIDWKFELYDLGNIIPGKELKDTYFAVSNVVAELVKNQILPVIIGGSQDLTIAQYKGYESLEQMVNMCAIDHRLDLGTPDEDVHADGFLSHLLLQRPCYLFNHANIGLQAPFASKMEFELFEKLYFDVCRLGEFNADFRKAEPHLRNTDLMTIDMRSIRASEIGTEDYHLPNGFYADQICQIMKYAGVSDKLTSVGIYNYFTEENPGSLSALVAQMIWYMLDGYSQRKGDFPVGSKVHYTKFIVHLDDFKDEIVFYRSNKSERWWMEVTYPAQEGSKYDRHHMVPCDKEDYERAMRNEMPDLWWKTYQKLV